MSGRRGWRAPARFRRFRSWLISVYRSLQQMLATNERASLTPEVAAVFDRIGNTEQSQRTLASADEATVAA